jgi:predicted porin
MRRAVAAAIAVCASGAYAQSSVTIFGVIDAAVSYGTASGPAGTQRWQLTNSGSYNSRLGFRGVEDLGGGLSAGLWLEGAVNNDNGTGLPTNINNQPSGGGATGTCNVTGATPAVAGVPVTCAAGVAPNGTQGFVFNRRSTVSLMGGWGELRLGRDFTPQYWNLTYYDPFGTGVGIGQLAAAVITGPTYIRASNSIGYLLPQKLGGLYGQAMVYLGENAQNGAATENDGDGWGVRLGYTSGAFDGAIGLSRTRYATGTVEQNNIGGQWNAGFAKFMALASRDRNGTLKAKGYLVGAVVPVGPGEIKGSWSSYRNNLAGTPKTSKIALGYVHNLSKRTALYATWARARNTGGAAAFLNGSSSTPNENSRGMDFGMRHAF